MNLQRRSLIALLGGLPLAYSCAAGDDVKGETQMYGLIGKMTAAAGQRAALSAILLEGLRGMPGNLSYIVANDALDADVLWITEAWSDKDAHAASLALPSVQAAIAKGRPLIVGMDRIAETEPVGGVGL